MGDKSTITNENVVVNGVLCRVDHLRPVTCNLLLPSNLLLELAIGWHDLCPTRIFGEYASEGWWSESNRTTAKVARPRRAALLPNSRGRS